MKKKNFLLGAAEIGVGLLLASPVDELLTLGIIAPAQAPITFVAGAALVYDGIKRL